MFADFVNKRLALDHLKSKLLFTQSKTMESLRTMRFISFLAST